MHIKSQMDLYKQMRKNEEAIYNEMDKLNGKYKAGRIKSDIIQLQQKYGHHHKKR